MSDTSGSAMTEIDTAAAQWVLRLEQPTVNEQDWLAFDAWLSQSPLHPPAYDRALAAWLEVGAKAGAIRALRDTLRPRERRPATRRRGAGSGRRRVAAAIGVAMAAGVAGVAVVQTFDLFASPVSYATRVGERRTLTLQDGTRVDLNGGSTLSVRIGRRDRRVTMDQAEAVFDVAHDPGRPFLITVGDRTVRVLGTEFNVRHRGDRISVTVRRGLVEVAPARGQVGATERLVPGKRLEHREGSGASAIGDARPEEAFAWRSGRLIYRDRPLGEVVADLNANFSRQIRLEGAGTADLRFSGVLVLDNEEAVVRRLTAFAPVTAQTSAAGISLRAESRLQR